MTRGLAQRAAALAVVALGFAALPAAADLGGFVIDSFHTAIEVLPNSDLLVEERIEVRFLEPRRGLYRTIPVRYTDPKGYAYSLVFRLIDVRDDNGAEHKSKVRNEGRYVNVRIGDPDRSVTGTVVYRLRYRIRRALVHFPEYDEIYWNAVGHEFRTSILKASASVRLPAPFGDDELQVAGYSGPFGSRGQEVRIHYPEPGVVWFTSPRALDPLEGLTVAVGWPKGAVEVPGAVDKILRFIAANWILLAPFLALFWLHRRYRTRGRDPVGRESIVVRYEPPDGVTAGELGTIVDEQVDLRDITATLVDLAVRGYLEISIEEQSVLFGLIDIELVVFNRLHDKADSELLSHERKVLDGVFDSGDRIELTALKQEFYKRIPAIKDALQDRMVARGWFSARADEVRTRFAAGGLGVGMAVVGLGLLSAWLRGGIFPHAVVLPIVAGVVTAVLFMAYAPAMPQRTRAGVDLRAWALGFEEFVDRVESDKLEADRRRSVFEALLPYAMSLGVATAWARRFEGIYEEEGPKWFAGHHAATRFTTSQLESSLSKAMTQTGEAMASSPRSSGSSGSGGGGSSGGGGGGGGGGSW